MPHTKYKHGGPLKRQQRKIKISQQTFVRVYIHVTITTFRPPHRNQRPVFDKTIYVGTATPTPSQSDIPHKADAPSQASTTAATLTSPLKTRSPGRRCLHPRDPPNVCRSPPFRPPCARPCPPARAVPGAAGTRGLRPASISRARKAGPDTTFAPR